MIARSVRAGLVETVHDGAVVAVDASGEILFASGDIDRPIYYRSAVKPIQATVAVEAGADLAPEQLALACASHGGFPAHLGIVRTILASVGLDESALQTPPSRPLADAANLLAAVRGEGRPRRIFHNCSGKHAGMLAACVAAGWPVGSYLDPDHPLQQRIVSLTHEATGVDPTPVGVDGCGAPTLRGSVRGLAVAFARLSVDPRFARAATAMTRFPGLVGHNLSLDGALARWWTGPVKVGAAGVIGAGLHGVGVAARSFDGNSDAAVVGLIAALARLGLVSDAARDGLREVATPPVLGGGVRVGRIEPTLAAVEGAGGREGGA